MAKEILQEFTFPKPELGIIVRDKILAVRGRGSTYTYEWDVSHHYQPTPDAGVYYPSLTSGDSPGYATALLEKYVDGIKYRVVENPHYRTNR